MDSTTQSKPPWPELLGSNNWKDLLDPFDINLRNLILRCGDFCQATYDAFNNDKNSKFAGSSRYGKQSFFHKVMLQSASDYQIATFLYATAKVTVPEAFFLHSLSREAWDRESNWIGYIATTTDEVSKSLGRREIYVVWRGTSRGYEWINVLGAKSESAEPILRQKKWRTTATATGDLSSSSSDSDEDEGIPKVMKGWLSVYISEDPNSSFTKLSARTQLMKNIKQLVSKYENEEISIIITGHSLGASLAILSAFDLAENGITNIPISAFVFGSPQVGNKAFNDRLNQFSNVKILHIKNKIDVIPLYPSGLLGYVDSGVLFEIDTRKSGSLKKSTNTGDWHNLQGMLHVVAGWNGVDGEFELKVERSLALVNKSSEFLKDELLIPGSWWIEKNKGMIMDENGGWVLEPPAEEDVPVPENLIE
ncbi:phospholipase A1-IIdelta [Cynara cardunculus var. scolymus]|uniref:Phospholipase A1 n=1 Tax=Cynara cardunculus var. scolymus TaxID=59895 RepID=A0A103Y484_CYNCS|nr:phospholipase A1-IIdelta [Cynara cardunculus var. scolymus]KVI02230.1 Lipase, class 3 [Cynara cardunculus var. scolymus]